MQEVMLKTHLIVSNIYDEYKIKWCGSIADVKPLLKNNMPIFIIISSDARVELNTIDINRLEECAKHITHPRGKQAVTTDIARIYIKEENGHEQLLGKVVHHHIKQYQQMYDAFQKE